MSGSLDHQAARSVLQSLATGAHDLRLIRQALDHVATCAECSTFFEVEREEACREIEDDLADAAGVLLRGGDDLAGSNPMVARHLAGCMRCNLLLAELMREPERPRVPDDKRVDPNALFEEALVGALLNDPETLVRARMAERLGSFEGPAIVVLGALAEAATVDHDAGVRVTALEALDRLDTQVSIPRRLVEEWAAFPERAASFISGVLERLATSAVPSVTGLVAEARRGSRTMAVTGQGGIGGELIAIDNNFVLRLRGLPAYLESTTPIVAVPTGLDERAATVRWMAEWPGLVSAPDAIDHGSVEVLLAQGSAAARQLFENMYLLSPDVRRIGAG
jgi:hypothetical protein